MSFAIECNMTKRDDKLDAFMDSVRCTGTGSALTGGPTPGESGHDDQAHDTGDLCDTDYSTLMGNVNTDDKPRREKP